MPTAEPAIVAIVVRGLTKRFGGFTAVSGIDFELKHGERLGLIGPNGAGKSTFVNLLTGTLPADQGNITLRGQEVTRVAAWKRSRMGLARTFQIPRPFKGLTIRENVEVAVMFAAGQQDSRQAAITASALLAQVGLEARANAAPSVLSQVELRKLELARALAANPKVLIADEAMAGLSDSEVDEILALLLQLNGSGIAVIMIEHIMRAVMLFSQRIVVMVAGAKIADGTPQMVMSNPEVERAYLGQ
ncbi:branched-chain amino acid transport system ATP-binding protein [Nitrobacteraceae bacterium AZCC 2161]